MAWKYAAETYFGVHASKLSILKRFLAGLVREPSFLGDQAHLADAIARQHQVIEKHAGLWLYIERNSLRGR